MTVIAAVADGETVWMAADTATNYSGTIVGSVRKIRRAQLPHGAGEILLAGSGDGAILAATIRAIGRATGDAESRLIPDGDLDTWAEDLADHVTNQLAALQPPITIPHPDGSTVLNGSLLLGYAGRLWHLFTRQAVPVPAGIAALGSGSDLAIGYLLGAAVHIDAEDARRLSRSLVEGAVRAACRYDPYCDAPDGPLVEILTAPGQEADGRGEERPR